MGASDALRSRKVLAKANNSEEALGRKVGV